MANNEILFNEKYKDMSDESLITLIKAGDSHAQHFLVEKYSNLVNVKATKFFLVGGENDDIVQEGMIGLYKAIKAFDGEKENSFKTFANLCIERQLITAIKMSNRQKHIPLNSSFSLNVSAFEENDDTSVLEVLDTKTVEDPLDTITKREYFTSVEDTLDKNLSKFEKDVLDLFVQGDSYIDIATKLKSTAKSVDNAIQRIRKKASKIIEDAE